MTQGIQKVSVCQDSNIVTSVYKKSGSYNKKTGKFR